MSITITLIAISYVAIIFLVLRTLHFVRDRNLFEPEFYQVNPQELQDEILEVKYLN
jgi:hypothetical protein